MSRRKSLRVIFASLFMIASCGQDHHNFRHASSQGSAEDPASEEIEFYAALKDANQPVSVFLPRGTINRFKGGDVKLTLAVKGKSAEECDNQYEAEFTKLAAPYKNLCEKAPQAPISKSLLRRSPKNLLSIGEIYPLDKEQTAVCIYAVNLACMAYPYSTGFKSVVAGGDVSIQGYQTDSQRYWLSPGESTFPAGSPAPGRPRFAWRPLHYNTVMSSIGYKPASSSFNVASEAEARKKMTEHFTAAFNAASASYSNLKYGPKQIDRQLEFRLVMRQDTINNVKRAPRGSRWTVDGHLSFVVQQKADAPTLPTQYTLESQQVQGFVGLKVPQPIRIVLPRPPKNFDVAHAHCPAGTVSLMNHAPSVTEIGRMLGQASQNEIDSECASIKNAAQRKLDRILLEFDINCTSSVGGGDRFHSAPREIAISQCFAPENEPLKPHIIAKARTSCCVQKRQAGLNPWGTVMLSTANHPEFGGTNRSDAFGKPGETQNRIDCGNKCGPLKLSAERQGVSLIADPSPGFAFKHWTCTIDGSSPRIFHGPTPYLEVLLNGWNSGTSQHCVAEFMAIPTGHGIIRVSHGGSHVTSPFHLTGGVPTINCGLDDNGVMNNRCVATVPLNTYIGLLAKPKLGQKIEYLGDTSLPDRPEERAWPKDNSDSGRCLLHTNALFGRGESDPISAWAARCAFKATQPENLVNSKSSDVRPHCTEPAPPNRPTCIR